MSGFAQWLKWKAAYGLGGLSRDIAALGKAPGIASVCGAQKWFGSVQNAKSFNDSGVFSAATYPTYGGGFKVEAESDFDAVRLVWVNRGTGAIVGKALVGVTETADTSVAASAFHPVIGGTTYNAVRSAGSVNGWQAVTWNSAATVSIAAATSAAQIGVSDWMPLSSIPRADGGMRPLLLVRAQISQADGSGDFCTYSNAGISAIRTPVAAGRNRVLQLFTGAAMVNTPASVNGAMGTVTFEVFPEFRYRARALSVFGVGDSIMQDEGLALTGIVTSWGWRGCADASTAAKPMSWSNVGCAGKAYTEYWARFTTLIAAGVKPSVLVVQPLSVNDYSGAPNNLPYYSELGMSRAVLAIEYARANGIPNVCLVPLLPYNSLAAGNDTIRKSYNTKLRALALNMGCGYLDFSALGDGASPERWIPAYNYSSDGIHPNETAIDTVMAPALTAYLRQI